MKETTRRTRRRWPWVILALALLLVGGPIAWQFRPLNTTERTLVGSWHSVDFPSLKYRFEGSRRYISVVTLLNRKRQTGHWDANTSLLRLKKDRDSPELVAALPWDLRLVIYFNEFRSGIGRSQRVLRFDGPNRLWLEDVEFVRASGELDTDLLPLD